MLLTDLPVVRRRSKKKSTERKWLGDVYQCKRLKMCATELYSVQSLERYQALHEYNDKTKYPAGYAAGLYTFNVPVTKPSAKLTEMICNYLEWSGHEANRLDTKGTYNVKTGSFIPTKTKTGTEDIGVRLVHVKHTYGVPWAIEIKIKDRQSDAQEDREKELKDKGFWYNVIKNMDQFFTVYDEKIKLLDSE